MKALLVDDERLARQELRRLLQAHADVTIVGEAATVDDAVAQLSDPAIDVLFLDIQMPGGSGFDVLERIDRVPLVVFTTAFDEFAVRAFDVNAFDYLLKPIRPERLATALDKTRHALATRRAVEATRVRSPFERIFVREDERCWIVPLGDIALFEGEGNYTRLYFGSNRPLIRSSLASLEARLDPAVFFRANRRQILNLRMVATIETAADDSYVVCLSNDCRVPVSRRQSKRLRENLSL
jgi:two-component system LytT family response regulator